MKRNAALSAMLLIFIGMMIALLVLTESKKVKEYVNEVETENGIGSSYDERSLKIISSTENKDLEPIILEYANRHDMQITIDYAGTLEMMDILNGGADYDAVWASNSIWLYMLEDTVKLTETKSTSINPIIFAVKDSKATELNFKGRDIYTHEIVSAIQNGQLKFNMSNPTQTNSGATAYLGLLSTLAGNPEVLKLDHIVNEELKNNMKILFNGLQRSSGSDEYLETMFLNGEYDAIVAYESTIINLNKKLSLTYQEPLYALYPIDGVSIADSPLSFVEREDNLGKKELFLEFQNYILGTEGQDELERYARRTWFGGVKKDVDFDTYNPNWGIDTTRYIVPIKFPSKTIIEEALKLYQNEFRKPIYTIFALDYSGSMSGSGYKQLCDAMEYILTDDAEADLLHYGEKDKITVIPFSTGVIDVWNTTNGKETRNLLNNILNLKPSGSTNIYDTGITALDQIRAEDFDTYNVSVIIMTDGLSNMGSYSSFEAKYNIENVDVPFYSIMFGSAFEDELQDIADLTNGKVFDGKTDLLKAFKEVRGYN